MSAADRGYVALLRRPGALPLFLWVNLARLVYVALPLALLLLVAGRRGSYADAGVTLAVFSIPGFLGPARARLVDRLGARRVLVALALGLFLAVTGLDLLAGGPLVVVLGLALLAGCTPPPVGPLMRAAWRELSGGDPDVLRRAYSLDSVGEDVLFVLGPLVAAAAASTSGASTLVPALAAVLVVAALGIGSCRPGRMPPSAPAHAAPALLRDPHFLVGLSPVAGLGLLLGGVEIASVAAALAVAGTSLAGAPAAAVSTGSVVGGLLYGSRGLPGSPRVQARWLVCVASGLVALTALGSSVFALLVGGLVLADCASRRPWSAPTWWPTPPRRSVVPRQRPGSTRRSTSASAWVRRWPAASSTRRRPRGGCWSWLLRRWGWSCSRGWSVARQPSELPQLGRKARPTTPSRYRTSTAMLSRPSRACSLAGRNSRPPM